MKKRLARKKPQWDEILRESHLIAAVRDKDGLQRALISPLKIVYLLFGNPMNITGMLSSVCAEGKLPLVNADLLQGFSRDAYAVEFLANSGTAGIISTHHETLRAAHSMELITVLRTFMIDSAAVDASRRFLAHFHPDAIELLPAVAAPLVLEHVRKDHPDLQVIAGGLVHDWMTVEGLISAGVDAISISNASFWEQGL